MFTKTVDFGVRELYGKEVLEKLDREILNEIIRGRDFETWERSK